MQVQQGHGLVINQINCTKFPYSKLEPKGLFFVKLKWCKTLIIFTFVVHYISADVSYHNDKPLKFFVPQTAEHELCVMHVHNCAFCTIEYRPKVHPYLLSCMHINFCAPLINCAPCVSKDPKLLCTWHMRIRLGS